MATPGVKVHPSKRHNNPMTYKSGKPRLRTLNVKQLTALVDKTQVKKEKAKITKEIQRRITAGLQRVTKLKLFKAKEA
jgi:hypothetical protein